MITDPVTGFTYPEAWVALCHDEEGLELTRIGLAVLTSSGTVLRRGYSTGTTASAACKAAIISTVKDVDIVNVDISCGISLRVPCSGMWGVGICQKFAGDYLTDATAGILITCLARMEGDGIEISFNEGVGRLTRPFNGMMPGEPAVSRSAMDSIRKATEQALADVGGKGVRLELSVKDGAEIAKKTMNIKLGIVGGISIAGSTGMVEPWEEDTESSVIEKVRSADKIVLTTGRIGLMYSRLLFPEREAILAGSSMKQAIEEARSGVILCGLPGLILKFLDPDVLKGTGCMTIEEMMEDKRWNERVSATLRKAKDIREDLRVVLVNRAGTVVGDTK